MYYVDRTYDTWFESPLGPERPIVFELIKVILLTTASCNMYGVMSRQPVIIIWFIYDIAMFINTIVAGWNMRLDQASVLAFPFFYSNLFIGLGFGLSITFACPFVGTLMMEHLYFFLGYLVFVAILSICTVKSLKEDQVSERLHMCSGIGPIIAFLIFFCGFGFVQAYYEGEYLPPVIEERLGVRKLNMLFFLVLNGMGICVWIITDGKNIQ